ncbi:MAG: hypothetical protein IJQ73_08980 [Kiritimatiellae bacterium]|nr:hypothetical protein [Kiritimatiellia bacterium]
MATSKKQDLEVHFLSLELAPALKPPRHSNHLLSLRLVCPRPTIAYKAAERTVTLADGVFAPESPKWTESVIFKETVSGRFGFAVEVTEPLSDAAAEAFVSTSASALVKFLAGFVGATFPVAELADVAEIPLSSLAKAVSKDKSVATLAQGCLDIPAEASFETRTVFEVPLVVARDVYGTVPRATKSGTSSIRRKILSKGTPAGVCRLSLEAI